MIKTMILLLASIFCFACSHAQVNVELLHQLVAESKSENSKQNNVRTTQATVSATETVNRSQMTSLKSSYRNIHSRFNTLGLMINAAEIGLEAQPIVDEIIDQQTLIVRQAENNPLLVLLAANLEADLAKQAQLLINYVFGIVLSIGDINQMKASDRKMLFGYVLTELQRLDGASRGLATALSNFNKQFHGKSLNPFAGFINQDQTLVDDIMSKAKALKK
jgi:hypothetical protein